jgi:hypothetical protein
MSGSVHFGYAQRPITPDLLDLARVHCLEIHAAVRRKAASAGAAVDHLLACSHTHVGPDTAPPLLAALAHLTDEAHRASRDSSSYSAYEPV